MTNTIVQPANPSSPNASEVGPMSLGDPALLEKIDRLFATGVDKYIDLPQLVVVGDQSSGKSSVLEGLTELPFPRDSGLCTRFATQISFKRAEEKRISVSINGKGDEEHNARMRAWGKPNIKELDAASFSEIMTEVMISPFRVRIVQLKIQSLCRCTK